MSVDIQSAKKQFAAHFGFAPTVIARAPGRVNIIGEHTDYNHGFVLPMAIERETVVLARPRQDGVLNAYAANFDKSAQARLMTWDKSAQNGWIDYVVGVAFELSKMQRPLCGADLMIIGDVPVGSGLSSSASLEMATLVLFEQMGGFAVEGPEGPLLGKRVENLFIGVNSGIMDQFIVRMGKAGHALFLDCRSHEYELVPVAFENARFVIANTGVTRGLSASKYNERVAECAEAVTSLTAATGRTGSHLRDFTEGDLESAACLMTDIAYRRARHVITEDLRTKAACEAMRAGNAVQLGALMTASDISLRDDYEVTCPELDAMTSIARALPGCYGARMTGAGFGGCAVSLVDVGATDAFVRELLARYREATGLPGEVIVSAPAEGAGPAS
ncbi:MAG TPA: galactokinase [Candidatus Hydrogenedentes bacterium]|nr:galactokinase [Candidatus Hydrogenedentota bacterium]